MNDGFPVKKTTILLATSRAFFYTGPAACIKEGLIFTGISGYLQLVLWHEKKKMGMEEDNRHKSLAPLHIADLPNFLLFIMIPVIIAWVCANKWPKYSLRIFAAVYLSFSILFLQQGTWAKLGIFRRLWWTKQQNLFEAEGRQLNIPIKELEPNAISFEEPTGISIFHDQGTYPNVCVTSCHWQQPLRSMPSLLFLVFIIWHNQNWDAVRRDQTLLSFLFFLRPAGYRS